jgi:GntR family transcriptional repressor for pyruvate dehydrogenase complex
VKPIERVPVVGQVVDNLQRIIQQRDLKPGDKMPTEKELVELFGVGRSTVREALRMLQATGEVEFLQGRGAFVAEKTEDPQVSAKDWFNVLGLKVADFMEMRIAVEPVSVRIAIQRATDKEVGRLMKAHNLFIKSIESGDPLQLAAYDDAFHMEIARATHNELFINTQVAIQECFFEARVRSFSIHERITGAIAPHQNILNAFYTKDAEAGYQAMLEHMTQAFKEIVSKQA